jgi:hypothetical protein
MMRRAAVVVATLLVLQAPAAAGWKVTSLGQGRLGNIAVDADGHSHICYLGGANANNFVLRYAFFNGKSWRKETVDTGGLWCSIALDSQGHPHIAYSSSAFTPSMLRYAAFDGTSWTTTTVDSGGTSTDIVMDANDHPHISYGIATRTIRYAHHDGTNWISETISSLGIDFGGTSIALNSAGKVYLTYSDQSGNLYLFSNVSGSWGGGLLDTGLSASLVLDSANRPRLFYESVQATKYAAFTGSMWSYVSLPQGAGTSLALDAFDRPHVSFGAFDPNFDMALTYGVDLGSGFDGLTLSKHDNSSDTSIAVDPLGLPRIISTREAGNSHTLRYAQLQLTEIGGAYQNISRTPVVAGDQVVAALEVSNGGNLITRPSAVRFFLSDDTVVGAGDLVVGMRNVPAIAPGKIKVITFKNTFATAVAGKHLIAVLDATTRNEEINKLNNFIPAIIP